MNLKLIFGVTFTIASVYLNAQVKESSTTTDTQVNKTYLKHIKEIVSNYQKRVEYAKANHQKPPTNITCMIILPPWILKQEP
ncbi:hypothetical protein [Kaistella sp.]|uniref:hypothetical protein n=1 Tax=Kaistella sp. TaxID=2782235 RepID=UPI0035A17AD8